MNTQDINLPQAGRRTNKERLSSRYTHSRQREDGFFCIHCHAFVSAAELLSRVGNRNHCPYCLWSRHLDLYTPGDRLSACKAPMEPVGLTRKNTRKKYALQTGELMLVHTCKACGASSINRIAADDDPENILQVFDCSQHKDILLEARLEKQAIFRLGVMEAEAVRGQLFGITRTHLELPEAA